jgi:hypothetical protein
LNRGYETVFTPRRHGRPLYGLVGVGWGQGIQETRVKGIWQPLVVY